jgi:hypothetical protein
LIEGEKGKGEEGKRGRGEEGKRGRGFSLVPLLNQFAIKRR